MITQMIASPRTVGFNFACCKIKTFTLLSNCVFNRKKGISTKGLMLPSVRVLASNVKHTGLGNSLGQL